MLSRAPPSANPMQHLEVRVVQQNGPKGDGRDRGLGHVIGGKVCGLWHQRISPVFRKACGHAGGVLRSLPGVPLGSYSMTENATVK